MKRRPLLGAVLILAGLGGTGWFGMLLLWAWGMWRFATDPSYLGLAAVILAFSASLGAIFFGAALAFRRGRAT
ncbi:MAG: hypothetical protein HYU62_10305 [Caulobacterales bacterium]|nr:hypothetical protein [Caulobacterales bacterium]